MSTWVDNIWEGSTVGKSVPFLVNPYKPNTSGYKISKEEYINQAHVDSITPDWPSSDPRWDDKEAWYSYFSDYIIWEWNEMDLRICPNYGYYAYNNIDTFISSPMMDEFPASIMGVVSGYGKVHKHEHGFRSEFMSILAFFIDKRDSQHFVSVSADENHSNRHSETSLEDFAQLISAKYQVPLLSVDEAKTLEKEYVG